MTDSWNDYAEEWDSNEDAISYANKAFNTLTEQVNLEGLNVLDFGCGTGLLTERMSPHVNSIVALDSSSKMIAILNNKNLPNVTTVAEQLSAESINKNASLNNSFDLIVASSVFAFLPDYESTLKLLKTLLVPDGTLVQWDWLSPSKDSDFGFSEEKIQSAYRNTGFNLTLMTKPFSLTSSKGTMTVIMAVANNS